MQSDTKFEVICCVESEVLQRNFQVQYLLDPCNYAMTIEVENIEFPVQLLGYAWGKMLILFHMLSLISRLSRQFFVVPAFAMV